MGKIVILMGQSSSGKDTIQKELFLQKKFVLKPLVLHTTRPPREGEQNGREYYFDTEEELLSILIQTDDGIRLNRALEREERQPIPNYKEMCRRFLVDQKDFSRENIEKRKIDAIIKNNGTLEETLEKVNKVLSLHL